VLGAGASTYHLWRLQPARAASPSVSEETPTPPGPTKSLRLDLLRGPFGLFIFSYLLFYAFQYFCAPVYPLYFVNRLHLSDDEIGLGNALYYGCTLLASFGLSRLSSFLGHRRLLSYSALILFIYPLLIGMASDARLYWTASVVGGSIFALVSGGLVNRLMERVPEIDRPAYMAFHNLALNMGILAGSLGGSFAGEQLGLREALFIGAGLRFIGGILLLAWG
jgi:predicted MFS family arabinose efflux permease